LFDRSRKGERALLVQPQWVGENGSGALSEFSELVRSAGATIVGSLSARIERTNQKFFVGSGKAEEFKTQKESTNADIVLVNHALSPVQERNLEALTECRVVVRT
jgi:GTP-binding protein HflX